MPEKKCLAVFFGGRSNEHEISVITGMLAVNLLREDFEVVPVYLPVEGGMAVARRARSVADFRPPVRGLEPVLLAGRELLDAKKPKRRLARLDCALNCCHGGNGEDGTLSALLRWNGVPLASPDTAVSAVFMRKDIAKFAARGLGLNVVPSFFVREREWREHGETVEAEMSSFGYPAIVKPARSGSSIGIRVVHNEEEFRRALALAFRLDDGALVERYLAGKRDLNIAAYRRDGEIVLSPIEEVFSSEEILSFEEKYESGSARRSEIPAKLGERLTAQIEGDMRTLYESFGVSGVVRADFLVDGETAYFNELNTVPGSLACYLYGESLGFARTFLKELIAEALAHPPIPKELFLSGVLRDDLFSGKSIKGR